MSFVVPDDKAEWKEMMYDRIRSCYHRDKNHPAVLIWSVGNESFGGETIYEMSELFRKLDDTRLVHYEGVFNDRRYNDSSDMESRMYAKVTDIEEYLVTATASLLSVVSTRMPWVIPVVRCISTQIWRTKKTPLIRAVLSGIILINLFIIKIDMARKCLAMAAILMTDHVIIILAEMVLFTAVHASLLRKCKK